MAERLPFQELRESSVDDEPLVSSHLEHNIPVQGGEEAQEESEPEETSPYFSRPFTLSFPEVSMLFNTSFLPGTYPLLIHLLPKILANDRRRWQPRPPYLALPRDGGGHPPAARGHVREV